MCKAITILVIRSKASHQRNKTVAVGRTYNKSLPLITMSWRALGDSVPFHLLMDSIFLLNHRLSNRVKLGRILPLATSIQIDHRFSSIYREENYSILLLRSVKVSRLTFLSENMMIPNMYLTNLH